MAQQFIPTALLFLALTSILSIKILAAEAPPKTYTEIVTPTPPASDASDDDYNDYQYKAEVGAAPSKSPSIATTTSAKGPSSSETVATAPSGDSAGAPSGSTGGATSEAGGASIAATPGPAAAGPTASSAPVTKFSAVAGLVTVAGMFFY